MKKKIKISVNKLLAYFITLLGIGGACAMGGCMYGSPAMEYGTPTATFKVHGQVSSEDQEKIPNIQAIMERDTGYTDDQGNYSVQLQEFPHDQEFLLEFKDVDGEENGSYQAMDTTIKFIDPEFINPEGGWYEGETSKELNISLKKED